MYGLLEDRDREELGPQAGPNLGVEKPSAFRSQSPRWPPAMIAQGDTRRVRAPASEATLTIDSTIFEMRMGLSSHGSPRLNPHWWGRVEKRKECLGTPIPVVQLRQGSTAVANVKPVRPSIPSSSRLVTIAGDVCMLLGASFRLRR